jgi:probable H4MPT-linked C1 transfer pathway protein
MNVIGLDVGGANIKASWIRFENGKPIRFRQVNLPFEIWKCKSRLRKAVLDLLRSFPKPDRVGVTMTGECSDAFRTKPEGVRFILRETVPLFLGKDIFVFTSDGAFRSVSEAVRHPLSVASANWRATGELVSRFTDECLCVDMGSTTTDVIPIKNGKVAALGRTDRIRLMAGELIYTGYLRTNAAHLVSSVPVFYPPRRGGKIPEGIPADWISTSAEWFCCMGDVHLILNHIRSRDYTSPTPDGRSKTRSEALRRLARLVCSDREEWTEAQLIRMAQYIYEEQKKRILAGLNRVRRSARLGRGTPIVCLGRGGFCVQKICVENGIPVKNLSGKNLPAGEGIDPSFSIAYLLGTGT